MDLMWSPLKPLRSKHWKIKQLNKTKIWRLLTKKWVCNNAEVFIFTPWFSFPLIDVCVFKLKSHLNLKSQLVRPLEPSALLKHHQVQGAAELTPLFGSYSKSLLYLMRIFGKVWNEGQIAMMLFIYLFDNSTVSQHYKCLHYWMTCKYVNNM